ncbi:MAG: hypothetical protein AAF962_14865 [Actinomycetota bacterium]
MSTSVGQSSDRAGLLRLLAILFAVALVAAACGGDSEDDASDETTEDTEAAETEEATEEDTGPTEEELAEDATAVGGLSDDALFGNGSEAWETAVFLSQEAPLTAEGEPVKLFMLNAEGSPGGSFPEMREGLEIAVDYINNELGGVGADIEGGVAGRPLELESCTNPLDPAAAQACVTESIEADPDIMVKGIDFFGPLYWGTWAGQWPVVDTLPIFVSDFTAPNSLATNGGCLVGFIAGYQSIVDAGHDRIAVVYSDNAPGQECWADTQERPLQYFSDTQGVEFIGIPDAPGDPADNDANVQEVINFLDGAENGAMHFGIQAADCAAYNDALDAAGATFDVYNAGSCADDAVTSADSATGKHFGFVGPPSPDNVDLLAQFPEYWQWEIAHREEQLIAAEPEAPRSTFMRGGFSAGVLIYQVLNDFIADGGDPSDNEALIAAMTSVDNQHRLASVPLDCANKVSDWPAICDFTATFFTWDGAQFTPHPTLGADPGDISTWTNARDLMEAVQNEVPRPEPEG